MYAKFEDDHGTEIKRIDWDRDEDGDFNDPDWALVIPTKGEQVWIPDHGLYEVDLIRWIMDEDDPHLLIRLSYIRRSA